MIQKFTLSILLFIQCLCFAQYRSYTTPIEGHPPGDYLIVNYVDWSISSAMDAQCGTKTYDGHQGTDYVLSGFQQMDSGVNVLAVDSGTVTFIHDGEFDRETVGDTSKRLGNFICVRQAGNYYAYYAHLKNGSILVSPGDRLVQGQVIAQVGSSGNSTDPHLHFELWYDSLYNVDPYAGICGNDSTFWTSADAYDTSFFLWRSGLINSIPTVDSLRFHKYHQSYFYPGCDGDYISYWALLSGFKYGDSLRTQWLMPDGNLWFEYSYTNTVQDYWYYYHWSYIEENLISVTNDWKLRFFHNGLLAEERVFWIGTCGAIGLSSSDDLYFNQLGSQILFKKNLKAVQLLDIHGKIILEDVDVLSGETLNLSWIKQGVYFIRFADVTDRITRKIAIRF